MLGCWQGWRSSRQAARPGAHRSWAPQSAAAPPFAACRAAATASPAAGGQSRAFQLPVQLPPARLMNSTMPLAAVHTHPSRPWHPLHAPWHAPALPPAAARLLPQVLVFPRCLVRAALLVGNLIRAGAAAIGDGGQLRGGGGAGGNNAAAHLGRAGTGAAECLGLALEPRLPSQFSFVHQQRMGAPGHQPSAGRQPTQRRSAPLPPVAPRRATPARGSSGLRV